MAILKPASITFGTFALEKLTRPFAAAKTLLPPPPRVPVVVPVGTEPEPEAKLEWGTAATTFSDMPHTDPVEDMDADGYLNPRVDGQIFVRSFPDIVMDGGLGAGTLIPAGQKRPPKCPPQDNRPGIRAYDEIDRQTRKIKVYNPDDAEQWVVVEQITSMRLRGPNGVIAKFNFKPPPPPRKPGT